MFRDKVRLSVLIIGIIFAITFVFLLLYSQVRAESEVLGDFCSGYTNMVDIQIKDMQIRQSQGITLYYAIFDIDGEEKEVALSKALFKHYEIGDTLRVVKLDNCYRTIDAAHNTSRNASMMISIFVVIVGVGSVLFIMRGKRAYL